MKSTSHLNVRVILRLAAGSETELPPSKTYMNQGKKKILAVLDDLLFTVKIGDIAKRAGLTTEFVKTEQDVFEKVKEQPLLIILDLNSHGVDPIRLIEQLKANPETKRISLIGYVSHVHGELKQRAHDAGCDMVMARSAFSQNLPLIMKRHASAA